MSIKLPITDIWRHLTPRQRRYFILFSVIIIIGLIVIFIPHIFFPPATSTITTAAYNKDTDTATDTTSSIPTSTSSAISSHVIGSDQLSELNDFISYAKSQLTATQTEIDQLKRSRSWLSNPTPTEELQLSLEQNKLQQQQQLYGVLVSVRELVHTRQRALTPLFSADTYNEARSLFITTQKQSASSSMQAFKWQMIFELFIGGGGRAQQDALEYLLSLLMKLIWQFTVGLIIAIVDFCIRIPFYLKEYEIFPWSDNNDHREQNEHHHMDIKEIFPSLTQSSLLFQSEDDDDHAIINHDTSDWSLLLYDDTLLTSLHEQHQSLQTEQQLYRQIAVESASWWTTVKSIILYILLVCGALVATIGLCLGLWSIPLGCVYLVTLLGSRNDDYRRPYQPAPVGYQWQRNHQD